MGARPLDGLVIQRVGAADAGLFQTIADDVFDQPVTPRALAQYLTAPGHLLVVALLEGTIVGQASGVVHQHPDKADELYVDEVGTGSAYLRLGIATGMLQELFSWGRELGCAEAWLGTDLDNDAANGLYRRFNGVEDTIKYYEFKL